MYLSMSSRRTAQARGQLTLQICKPCGKYEDAGSGQITTSGVVVSTGVSSPATPSGLRARLQVGHCNAGLVCGCRASRDMVAALLRDGDHTLAVMFDGV
jgi:hypothetical protein